MTKTNGNFRRRCGILTSSRTFCSLTSSTGLGVQEEQELILIVADAEHKLQIMQAIGENCGVHSEAKGVVLSLPIDNAVGLA